MRDGICRYLFEGGTGNHLPGHFIFLQLFISPCHRACLEPGFKQLLIFFFCSSLSCFFYRQTLPPNTYLPYLTPLFFLHIGVDSFDRESQVDHIVAMVSVKTVAVLGVSTYLFSIIGLLPYLEAEAS